MIHWFPFIISAQFPHLCLTFQVSMNHPRTCDAGCHKVQISLCRMRCQMMSRTFVGTTLVGITFPVRSVRLVWAVYNAIRPDNVMMKNFSQSFIATFYKPSINPIQLSDLLRFHRMLTHNNNSGTLDPWIKVTHLTTTSECLLHWWGILFK